MKQVWAAVDDYFEELLAPEDRELKAILATNRDAGLPSIDVPPLLGKFLAMVVQMCRARRVLEIGTLGGYSTIWLARALPADGRVVTLEINSHHAEIARENLRKAGVLDQVEICVASAADTLQQMHEDGAEPFDLIFLDADKRSLPQYLEAALKLSHPGTVILADNVVRDGKVIEADSRDADVQGVRNFTELLGANPRLQATAFQTVNARGYDGFAIAVVTG